jgi:hypothetical protein
LPIDVYFDYIESALNIGNWKRGEALELQTTRDKKEELLRDVEYFRKQGFDL